MKKRRTVEKAKAQPLVVEISRARVIVWLIYGSVGAILFTWLLLAKADNLSTRVGCVVLLVACGILPLLVVLMHWPGGQAVIRMTESHLEVPRAKFPWKEIRSAKFRTPYRRSHSIMLILVDGSIRRIEDGLYTLSLRNIYREICKRLPDADPEIRRNDPCPCGSRRKYKKCCGKP